MDFEFDDDDDAPNEFAFEINNDYKSNENDQNQTANFIPNNDDLNPDNDSIFESIDSQKKKPLINLDDIFNNDTKNNEDPKNANLNLFSDNPTNTNMPNDSNELENLIQSDSNKKQSLININQILDSSNENGLQDTQNQNNSGNKKLVFNLFKKKNPVQKEEQNNESNQFSLQNESNNETPTNKKPLIDLDDLLGSSIQSTTVEKLDKDATVENGDNKSSENESKRKKKSLIDLNEIIDSQIQSNNETANSTKEESNSPIQSKSNKKPLIDLNDIIDSRIQAQTDNSNISSNSSEQTTETKNKKPLIDLDQLLDSNQMPQLAEKESSNSEQNELTKTANLLAVQILPPKDSSDDDSIDAFQGQTSVFYTDTSIEKTRLPADDQESSETEKQNLSSLGPPPRPLFKPKQQVSRSVPSSQLGKPRIIRPVTNATHVRRSKGFSIDKFDPNHPHPFTDPLTKEACKNLGISIADITYPNMQDLRNYTRDPKLHQSIRERLIQRVDQNIETIKQERDRISCLPDFDKELRKPINLSQPLNGENEIYNNYEIETMSRLKAKNKREAEQLLMNIFIEKEILAADTEAKLRLLEQKKQKEEERKEQIRLDKQHQQEMLEREAKKEKERRNEINRKFKEQQERDKQFEERQREHLEMKLLKCQEEEQKRKMKNEAAHKQFKESEKQRLIQYDKTQKELLEREAKFKEQKLKEQKERELRIKEEDEQKMKHILAVRQNEKQKLEQKRKKTLEKAEKQQEDFLKVCKERDEKLEQNKQKHKEKIEHYQNVKHEIELQIEDKNRNFMMNEREKEQRFMERMEEDYYKRQEKALDKKIIEEDHLNNANRYEKLLVQKATEKVKAYELRLKQIQEKKEEHRRKVIQAEIMRRELQREKDKIANMGISMKELAKKSPKQLQNLANSLDIDIEAIQEKAKKMTKGRNSVSKDSGTNND